MKRSLIITTVVGIFMLFLTSFIFAAEEHTEEPKLITQVVVIKPYEVLEPSTLISSPGTTVVWVNYAQFPIEILFLDKKVVFACGVPVNYFLGKGGAYESGKISKGSTASLCFTQPGKYDYIVKSSRTLYLEYGKPEREESKGTIWIK